MGQSERQYMEDAVFADVLDLAEIQPERFSEALEKTCVKMDSVLKKHDSGAVLATGLVWKNKIWTANVGDAAAFFFYRNGDFFSCKKLSELHRPDQPSEKARIEAAGGIVLQYGVPRLNAVLAVSRGFGDAQVGDGLIATPAIKYTLVPTETQSYLLLCSDGLTDVVDTETMADIFQASESFELVAKHLRALAYQKGGRDNTTVLVVPVISNEPKPLIVGVIDGHGGFDVAEYLQTHFVSALMQTLSE
jgi:serine/threonine protein phosphatase PrpC